MGDGFKVNEAVLDRLSRDLNNVADMAKDAAQSLEDASSGSLGADDLDDACNSFKDDWSYGLDLLKDAIGDTAKGLDMVAHNYEGTDDAIAAGLNKFGEA